MFQKENGENELWDELYLKYIEVISKVSSEGPFYKHYILGNVNSELFQSVITIQESTSIVSQGTTGLCTWQVINLNLKIIHRYYYYFK